MPELSAPPVTVVPNRAPAWAMASGPEGVAPSVPPTKLWTIFSVPAWVYSNTVPSWAEPPATVVPNRSPVASATRPACGKAPSVPPRKE